MGLIVLSFTLLLLSNFTVAHPFSQWDALLDRRGVGPTDPFDFGWISSYAALGDSYATGLGAGHVIKASQNADLHKDCDQYSYGFPNILNSNDALGFNSNRRAQVLSCSSGTLSSILSDQVLKIQKSQLVTPSAGINNANFVNRAKDLINAPIFTDDLKALLAGINDKLVDDQSRVFWVGYERFWNPDTDACNDVSWAYSSALRSRKYLTKDKRKQMNDITDALNDKIKTICGTNSRCVFVDTNGRVDHLKGRFCEDGVKENDSFAANPTDGANREET
ncbi:hypothetical protein EJ08DRAFT_693308 [Tothia fuscella]|uniref:Uncharacterized protein n=1 Tax=Tothia fuscella TaxID=1048955 RepID=A0A9P4U3D2_9PEZI|nr:hypothetical protein EJ08DRAFT_693308 [Tothia fuscella]